MSFIDRFLNAIKLNDDFDEDDDFLDDEDDVLDEEDDEDVKPKPRKRFFSKFSLDDDDDDDDYEEYDEEPVKTSRTSKTAQKTGSSGTGRSGGAAGSSRISSSGSSRTSAGTRTDSVRSAENAYTVGYASRTSDRERSYGRTDSQRTAKKKTAPSRRRGSQSMEVNVLRPASMEDTREIADTLMAECTVVLNLEGLDVDIAQRVIDFTCGVCYSLEGSLQKISSYIFILTPANVDISGDYQSILDGAFDLPSMRSGY